MAGKYTKKLSAQCFGGAEIAVYSLATAVAVGGCPAFYRIFARYTLFLK